MAEMYNWDKSLRDLKSRKNTQTPSFSSTLLDEIYRSIDGNDEKFGEFKIRNPKAAKKLIGGSHGGGGSGGGRGRSKSSSVVEDEEIATFRRACLVDKWMEMKSNEKGLKGRRVALSLPEFDRKMVIDNDPIFFSSGSSSSDSSFGWHSEAEAVKPKPSCFGPLNRLKKVKTNVSQCSVIKKPQNEFYMFDDDQTNNSGLIRSKTRALKIYTSLKKVKQPISPGGRLTTFLNALFTNGHAKKAKDSGFEETRTERKTKSTNATTCSSASSFSRSCLSKNTPKSRDQITNGLTRTVRFQDSRSYGVKNVCNDKDFENTFPFPRMEEYDDKKSKFDDEEDDDMASDSSSDLFELDHLAIFAKEQYCEELPVYETTHLGTNRAIASGLIC